jgi:cytochrome c peroxidase
MAAIMQKQMWICTILQSLFPPLDILQPQNRRHEHTTDQAQPPKSSIVEMEDKKATASRRFKSDSHNESSPALLLKSQKHWRLARE